MRAINRVERIGITQAADIPPLHKRTRSRTSAARNRRWRERLSERTRPGIVSAFLFHFSRTAIEVFGQCGDLCRRLIRSIAFLKDGNLALP